MTSTHWSDVRTFNIPVNEQMLKVDGFERQLRCTLKTESPRREGTCQLRTVLFDREYVLVFLRGILKRLGISWVELAALIGEAAEKDNP